jgi:hypothetical protein
LDDDHGVSRASDLGPKAADAVSGAPSEKLTFKLQDSGSRRSLFRDLTTRFGSAEGCLVSNRQFGLTKVRSLRMHPDHFGANGGREDRRDEAPAPAGYRRISLAEFLGET